MLNLEHPALVEHDPQEKTILFKRVSPDTLDEIVGDDYFVMGLTNEGNNLWTVVYSEMET